MNRKKIVILFVFLITVLLMGNISVKADLTPKQHAAELTVETSEGYNDRIIPVKQGYSSELGTNTAVYCISGFNSQAPQTNNVCTLSNQDETTSLYLASIIKAGGNINISNPTLAQQQQYFYTEIAIAKYLNVLENPELSYSTAFSDYMDEAQTILDKAKAIYDDAIATKNRQFDVKFYDEKTNTEIKNLSFYESEGYYRTNNIKVSGINISTNLESVKPVASGVEGVEVIGNANSFYVRVKKENLKVEETNKIVVRINNIRGKEYSTSYKYTCGGGSVQDVVVLKNESETKSIEISGDISIKTRITIKKVDEKGKPLAGVFIRIENEDKSYNEDFITNENGIIILEDMALSKYFITEISAPKKYVISSTPKEVNLSLDNLEPEIVIKNELTRVEIRKINATDNSLLKGARLQIQDKDGNVIKDEKGKAYEWVTTEESFVIEGLEVGTYYLVEISAPEGFELNKEKLPFTVDQKNKVIKVEMKNELEVEVPNTLSSRSALLLAIAMFDIALGIGIVTYVKKNKIEE